MGISTSELVRSESQVIRHDMAWTVVVPGYLVVVGFAYFRQFSQVMQA